MPSSSGLMKERFVANLPWHSVPVVTTLLMPYVLPPISVPTLTYLVRCEDAVLPFAE